MNGCSVNLRLSIFTADFKNLKVLIQNPRFNEPHAALRPKRQTTVWTLELLFQSDAPDQIVESRV